MVPISVQVAVVFIQFCLLLVALIPLTLILSHVVSRELDVPFVRTPRSLFAPIIEALQYQSGDIVYELGSGDGSFLLTSARLYPHVQFIGIELNPLLYFYAQVRWRMAGAPSNITFRRENFYTADISNATKIYAYLLPSVMNALLPKFTRELKNARIVSRAFKFSEKVPDQTIQIRKRAGRYGEHLLYIYHL